MNSRIAKQTRFAKMMNRYGINIPVIPAQRILKRVLQFLRFFELAFLDLATTTAFHFGKSGLFGHSHQNLRDTIPRLRIFLIAALGSTWMTCVQAQPQYSIEGGLGETLSPSMLRLTIDDVDIIFSTLALISIGNRMWSNGYFVSAGLGYSRGLGFYGGMGKQFLPLDWSILTFELIGFGDSTGNAGAQSYISLGVKF